MRLDYVPLLKIQREFQGMPRDIERFRHYLRTIWNCFEADFELIPLMIANPMGKEHVTKQLDELLNMDAERVGADAATEASSRLSEAPGEFKAAVVVADDLKGGWTNRFDYEFNLRFGWHHVRAGDLAAASVRAQPPRWSKFVWVYGVLWSSEQPSLQAVRDAMLLAAYRMAYLHVHGFARSLREMLAQEGQIMALAGCTGPALDEEDIAYTREVLEPLLGASDKRTCMECLFGDAAGRTLGFTPRGLSPWAGLALAFHDAQQCGAAAIKR